MAVSDFPAPGEKIDVTAVKAAMLKHLSDAWETALLIVDEGERDALTARLDQARMVMYEKTDQPAQVFGERLSKILFNALQAGLNVTAIDSRNGDLDPHEVDPDKSTDLYGTMNASIMHAKNEADSLKLVPLP